MRHALPSGVPLWQWVVTFPFELHGKFGFDASLLGIVSRIVVFERGPSGPKGSPSLRWRVMLDAMAKRWVFVAAAACLGNQGCADRDSTRTSLPRGGADASDSGGGAAPAVSDASDARQSPSDGVSSGDATGADSMQTVVADAGCGSETLPCVSRDGSMRDAATDAAMDASDGDEGGAQSPFSCSAITEERECRGDLRCIWAAAGGQEPQRCHERCDTDQCPAGSACEPVDFYPECEPLTECDQQCPGRAVACVSDALLRVVCETTSPLCDPGGDAIDLCVREHLPGLCSIGTVAAGCVATADGTLYFAPRLSFREYVLLPGWRFSGDDYNENTLTADEQSRCLSLSVGCPADAG